MKTKSFDQYLVKRLSKEEILDIQYQAKLEKEALMTLQNDIVGAITNYMKDERIGFNELIRRLDVSPSQLTKMKKGKANLTLASIAHIFALLKRKPHLVFKKIA